MVIFHIHLCQPLLGGLIKLVVTFWGLVVIFFFFLKFWRHDLFEMSKFKEIIILDIKIALVFLWCVNSLLDYTTYPSFHSD
jgi:hypothetical protein